jgi:membrane-bound lytic murein transglycosylase B
MKKIKTLIQTCSLAMMVFSPVIHALEVQDYAQLETLIKQVSKKTGYSADELQQLFRQVEIKPRIIKVMDRPAESMPWHKYRKLFLTEKNIVAGVEFWRAHADVLARAEKKFGVPPEIIVATLGVETRYGTNTGSYRVIDALSTLAFEYPRRSKYFSAELKNFLLLTDAHQLQPLQMTGSYAGAIGLPQFMPSSYLNYAVDFSGDGYSDLVNSMDDAIGSIASYYRKHGWKTGKPVSWPAQDAGSQASKLVVKKRKTDRTLHDLLNSGVTFAQDGPPDMRVGLIRLDGESGPEYRAAFENFFVITRYNTSKLYATAVQLLGEEIKQRVQAQ